MSGMAKVLGTAERYDETVTIGAHTPITVDFTDAIDYQHCVMWRIGDSRSLLQLWMQEGTGRLQQLEVVLVDAGRARTDASDPESTVIDRGLPIFDVGESFLPDPEWDVYTVMEEKKPFDLVLHTSLVRLLLDDVTPVRTVGTERVSFGLDACDRPCRIDVKSLGSQDIAELRAYLDRLARYQGTRVVPDSERSPRKFWRR